MAQPFDLASILEDLLYGSDEAAENTLRDSVAEDVRVRVNGQLFVGDGFAAHVRDQRSRISPGGSIQVLEQFQAGDQVAGRYVFTVVSEQGPARFESHIFAGIRDGRLVRMSEMERQCEDGDALDLLARA